MSAVLSPTTATPDLAAVKTRQQAAWSTGNYAVVGTLQLVGEQLCEALDPRAGWRVLDVAAGNGNATLAAARRGCVVTPPTTCPRCSTPAGSAQWPKAMTSRSGGRCREAAFADASFDAVLSTFGVMFTPDQEQAAREMLRGAAGGKIGRQRTPDSFIGQLFRTIGKYVPPAARLKSPALWGTQARLQELFGTDARAAHPQPRVRVPLPLAATLDRGLRTYYGPTNKAFAALDAGGQAALQQELLALWPHATAPAMPRWCCPANTSKW